MNKTELLEEIRSSAREGSISRDEILKAYKQGAGETTTYSGWTNWNLFDVLSFAGGFVVFLGIAILVEQHWAALHDPVKIGFTLGLGTASYLAGVLLIHHRGSARAGRTFFLVSALLLPVGLIVIFHLAGWRVDTPPVATLITGILTLVYVATFVLYRRTMFLVFTVLFATGLYFSITEWMIGEHPLFEGDDLLLYQYLTSGLSYLFIGYAYCRRRGNFAGFLYGLGSFFVLGSALGLGGWPPDQNLFWEIIYPALILAILFLSIWLDSKSFLVFGTLFLMAYIVKITAEYFTGTMGWPLALVLAGFFLIGVGYLAIWIHNRWMSPAAPDSQP